MRHTQNCFDEKGAFKLLIKVSKLQERKELQLEKRLFNYIYNSTGNKAVLIDGVDEVSPHYTNEVIQILRILSKAIRKFWVMYLNSIKHKLEKEFQ